MVQDIFISLRCVCFASAEARCHICHVCSGFYGLLLITLYRPHERTGICEHELGSACFFSSPEGTGDSSLLTFFPLPSVEVAVFPKYALGASSHLMVLWKLLILATILKKKCNSYHNLEYLLCARSSDSFCFVLLNKLGMTTKFISELTKQLTSVA